MRVLLPTMELVYDRASYCDLFDHCDDGIRGVIRDAVNHYNADQSCIEKLIAKLMSQYENSYTAIFHATVENYSISILVELSIRNLIDEVHNVIYNLYRTKHISFNTRYCQWVGNDIVVIQER